MNKKTQLPPAKIKIESIQKLRFGDLDDFLNENAEQLLTNVELMDLVTYAEEAIGEENKQIIDLGIQRHRNGKN